MRRVLQEGKADLHSYAHTAKRRQPSLGVGLYAPTATLAKRHQLFGAVLLSFKGAFEQAKSNRCLDYSSVRMPEGADTTTS